MADRSDSHDGSQSSDDDQSHSASNITDDVFDNFAADRLRGSHKKVAVSAVQRRRRRFSPGRRKEVAAVRKIGACRPCHVRKVRCTHALGGPSSAINISKKAVSRSAVYDDSGPSSLSPDSSIITKISGSILDIYINTEDDPWTARSSNRSWTSDSDKEKIDHIWNTIPDQYKDVEGGSSLSRNNYVPEFDGRYSSLPFFLQPTKDEQIQSIIPTFIEPLEVFPAHHPLPSGERPPWDRHTGRETTQPSMASRSGVNKNKKKKNIAPASQGATSMQGQQAVSTQSIRDARQRLYFSLQLPYVQSQNLSPGWTPLQGQTQSTDTCLPRMNDPPQGSSHATSFSPSSSNQMGSSHQPFALQQVQLGQAQQTRTFDQTPLQHHYAGPPSRPRSNSVNSIRSMQSENLGGGMQQSQQSQQSQQHFAHSPNLYQQSHDGFSPMLRRGSAHSNQSLRFVNIGMQQMQITSQDNIMLASYPRDYSTTAQSFQRQQPLITGDLYSGTIMGKQTLEPIFQEPPPRDLNQVQQTSWSGNRMQQMHTPSQYHPMQASYSSAYNNTAQQSYQQQLQPTVQNYHEHQADIYPSNHGSILSPTQPLPLNSHGRNMSSTRSSNVNTPSTSNSSHSMHHHDHSLALPVVSAIHSTSQPPSLGYDAASEITPGTPFDATSHYSHSDIPTSRTREQPTTTDAGFFSVPDQSMEQLFPDLFTPQVNTNINDANSRNGTIKPPPSVAATGSPNALDPTLDFEDLSEFLHSADGGAEAGNLSDWLFSSPGMDFVDLNSLPNGAATQTGRGDVFSPQDQLIEPTLDLSASTEQLIRSVFTLDEASFNSEYPVDYNTANSSDIIKPPPSFAIDTPVETMAESASFSDLLNATSKDAGAGNLFDWGFNSYESE